MPAEPSFKRDILPILQAVSDYRWVSDFSFWGNFPEGLGRARLQGE